MLIPQTEADDDDDDDDDNDAEEEHDEDDPEVADEEDDEDGDDAAFATGNAAGKCGVRGPSISLHTHIRLQLCTYTVAQMKRIYRLI